MLSRSIIEDSRSIIDNSRVILLLVVSFSIIIHDHHILIVRITAENGAKVMLTKFTDDKFNAYYG
jgi:hypothetical protein